ncbi:MAG: protein kinase [Thermoguttaceae bacterium]|jgi:WD40 repeat protein
MSSTSQPSEHDRQLEQLMAEYLHSVDRGAPLDRAKLLDDHPQLADELASFFRNQDAIARLAGPLKAEAALDSTLDSGRTDAARDTVRVRYFGEYELVEEIARGGMGVVYKAKQSSLSRTVALKMILSGQLASRGDVERFHAEAEAAANLDHPHIVPIYEVGEHEGQHYFTMKLMEGGSLAERMAGPPWPVGSRLRDRWAAETIATVARAVHHAHQRRILHRDLKPANILFDVQNQPFVTDFGLAKQIAGDSHLTQSGAIVGTPAYMAPEQAAANELTTAADVYSLGAILYELLAGRPPLRGETPMETLLLVMNQTPATPCSLHPRLDRDLATICLKCLEKEPARRYDSAAALADDLEHWLAGEPIGARAVGNVERVWRWFRRHPARLVVAGVVAGLVLLVIATGVVGYRATSSALDLSQQRLYAAHINLAQSAGEAGDDGTVMTLLEQHVPKSGAADLRGWEWYYERGQCRILQTLSSRRDVVSDVAWSPNGQWLAASVHGPVRVWDVARGQIAFTLDAPFLGGFLAEPLAFSPDGRWLAAAHGEGGDIDLWDIAARRLVYKLSGHSAEVTALAWSTDSQRLASAGRDKTAHIWRADNGQSELLIPTQLDSIKQVVWVAEGRQLAIGGKLWSTTDGREIRALSALSWSADGRRFMDGFSLFDAANCKLIAPLQDQHEYNPSGAIAWSPDGRSIAMSGNGAQIKVWDAVTGKRAYSLQGRIANHLAFSPDCRRLAAADYNGTITIWDATPPAEVAIFADHASLVQCAAFHPDNRLVASADWGQNIRVWDVATRKTVQVLAAATPSIGQGMPHGACGVAFSSDGACLAAGCFDGTVKVWDAKTWQITADLKGQESFVLVAGAVAWSADNRFLACATPRKVRVWETATWHEALTQDHGMGVLADVAWRHQGEQLAFIGINTLHLWDAGTQRPPSSLGSWANGASSTLAWSPDDRRLAFASNGGGNGIDICEAASGRLLHRFANLPEMIRKVCWSPDGRRLFSTSQDGTVKVWDAEAFQELLTLRGQVEQGKSTQAFGSLALSPDGRVLVATQGNRIYVWEAKAAPTER